MRQSTLRKLDRYTFKCGKRGPLTCSTKSVYSLKEDILSEEQDGDDEDSIHNGGDTIMDEEEDEEILSEHSGSAAAVEIEEEKLFTDNRSALGDNEMEIPCYYCTNCKQ